MRTPVKVPNLGRAEGGTLPLMRLVEIIRRPTEAERSALVRFVLDVTAATGSRPLSDHLWLDLDAGGSDGFLAATVSDSTGMIAVAQISAANETSSLEVVVRHGVDDAQRVHDDIVETTVDAFRAGGGGRLSWWVDEPTDQVHSFAHGLGLTPMRGLHEMRRRLPAERHASVETRSFVPGVDDENWLAINNRAFAGHGEQGGWTRETLATRVAEPWFDADGFRLHELGDRLAAFCWTKLHHDLDPVVGEIYVIAVDPDFHGRGLGRELTLAGLDSISARDVSVANLYVDADNVAAVGLYETLGFTIHRSRQVFGGDLAPHTE